MRTSSHVSEQRLHLGCGHEILSGWVNHDIAPLPGVDIVHDLDQYPWPFEDESFDQVRLYHVLEHLAEPMRAIEELHRITKPGGLVEVRVPYWNSQDWASDPTHKSRFNEYTFDFFDPSRRHGRTRPYYSKAKFSIRSQVSWIKPVWLYMPVRNAVGRRLLSALARHLGGVIWVVEWELVALKD
jgi:SAM-dependent methyltransferase